jgi:hypothetical protein
VIVRYSPGKGAPTLDPEKMMINKKVAFVASAVALASIASPVFATTARHRYHYAHRAVSNYQTGAGYRANAAVVPDPVDNPATTGGGSMGYNQCAGHPSC